jgi:hypothetical protein
VQRLLIALAVAAMLVLAAPAMAAGQAGANRRYPQVTPMPPGVSSAHPRARAATTRSPAATVPRTGGQPGLVALLGAGLVLTGAGLKLRLRAPVA